ncbi:glycosyltransferase [Pontixanthobacter gangjinensis]|uniref:Glycosyltransferase n=1 Tax=Christiangramia aestuarii TaxID=1028746 RepID=A0A7K1LNL6_9FLAO|nr:glycosyltransferase [Christiangramia aestuarii]MUP42241.1 glycosyltransferase [Christiangramia aestuarii]
MGNKRILVAALNWGLGHATRCVPIINELIDFGYEPVIASDGPALELLKMEFPQLLHRQLPSYNIEYAEKASGLKWKLLQNSPHILRTIQKENRITEELVDELELSGIISDNRWGVRSQKLKKNVFITHQLKVLSGSTSFLSTYIQRKYIAKFQQCWVPDVKGENNLSGILGHPLKLPGNVKYIGRLSRLKKVNSGIIYDYLVLLSGPEPQRSILESILLKQFENTERRTLFVRGVIHDETIEHSNPFLKVKNYLFGKELEEALNGSRYIISRSGYTTLMDLACLHKKAFFIPTPGQPEQEYLAERMERLGMAAYSKQDDFSTEKLEKIEDYRGLSDLGDDPLIGSFLTFFEGE